MIIWLFRRFWDTPVVKSSSRELCYIILAGICLGYLCTFSLIAKPHLIYCYLQRLGIGLSPAMSYSALVTKVGLYWCIPLENWTTTTVTDTVLLLDSLYTSNKMPVKITATPIYYVEKYSFANNPGRRCIHSQVQMSSGRGIWTIICVCHHTLTGGGGGGQNTALYNLYFSVFGRGESDEA